MPGKKNFLADILVETGLAAFSRRLRPTMAADLVVLAYHRVFDVSDAKVFPYDLELVSASTDDFRRQMEHLKRNYTVVTMAQVLAALDGGVRLPSRPVVVTFDDGHADNFTNAFPVLREFNVPATIFLTTDYIGSERTFWFDHVANLLLRLDIDRLHVPGLEEVFVLNDHESRRFASRKILRYLARVSDVQRRKTIGWIEACPVSECPSRHHGLSGAMTWEQIQEMAAAGCDFGSHTVSHPILSQLEAGALEHELVESRTTIGQHIGRSVETIAYPEGMEHSFNPVVTAAVRKAGYRLGFSYIPGTNVLARLDRFAVRRLAVERYTSFNRFCAMLEFPELFH